MDEVIRMKYRDREFTVPAGITVREALLKVGLAPETILAVRDGKLVFDDAVLRPGEALRLIHVVSGG